MLRAVTRHAIEARWQRAGFPDYPLWIPLIMDGSAVSAGLIATGQRLGEHPLAPTTALLFAAMAPWLLGFGGLKLRWWLFAGPVIAGAVTAMVLYPVDFDFAIFLVVLMAGHLAATDAPLRSATATAGAGAVLVVLDWMGQFNGSPFWFAALVVGWDVGFMLQYQQRRLNEQQKSQAAQAAQSALEERQRIAREVHDVVAHSLSVTMLHLTAARRDLEEDAGLNIDIAVDSLREAERVGRQAMTDIRRTVGLLGADSGLGATPTPSLMGVRDLVAEFSLAGLAIETEITGDLESVPPAASTAGYRIVQESLSNVAKHAPGCLAVLRLVVTADALHISVSNPTAGRPRQADHHGSGIRGMQQRAQLLGGDLTAAGDTDTWRVVAAIPLDPQAVAKGPQHTTGLTPPVSGIP